MIQETSWLESNLYYKFVRIIKVQPIQKTKKGFEYRNVFVEIDLFKKSGSKRTILTVGFEKIHAFDDIRYNDYLLVGIRFYHKYIEDGFSSPYKCSAQIMKFRIVSKEYVYSLKDKYVDSKGNIFRYETPYMSIVMEYNKSTDIVSNKNGLKTRYVFGDVNIIKGQRVKACFIVAKDMVDIDLLENIKHGDKILLIYFPVFASWTKIRKDKFGVFRRHFKEQKYFHISRVSKLEEEDIENWTKSEEIDLTNEKDLLKHPLLAKFFAK